MIAPDVTFARQVDLDGVTITGRADLRGAVFAGPLLARSEEDLGDIGGDADFSFAAFRDSAAFDGIHFHGVADFTGARFGSDASFIGASFDSDARFDQANFDAFTSFNGLRRGPGGDQAGHVQRAGHVPQRPLRRRGGHDRRAVPRRARPAWRHVRRRPRPAQLDDRQGPARPRRGVHARSTPAASRWSLVTWRSSRPRAARSSSTGRRSTRATSASTAPPSPTRSRSSCVHMNATCPELGSGQQPQGCIVLQSLVTGELQMDLDLVPRVFGELSQRAALQQIEATERKDGNSDKANSAEYLLLRSQGEQKSGPGLVLRLLLLPGCGRLPRAAPAPAGRVAAGDLHRLDGAADLPGQPHRATSART